MCNIRWCENHTVCTKPVNHLLKLTYSIKLSLETFKDVFNFQTFLC